MFGFDEPEPLSVLLPLVPVVDGEVVPLAGAFDPELRPEDEPDVVCEVSLVPLEMPGPTPPSRDRDITGPALRPCGDAEGPDPL